MQTFVWLVTAQKNIGELTNQDGDAETTSSFFTYKSVKATRELNLDTVINSK